MEFKEFIADEKAGEKKRTEIEKMILKIVKKKLIDKVEKDGSTTIRFDGKGPQDVKDVIYEIIVTLDYFKRLYKGTQRAIYINIIKESDSWRQTDYIAIEIDRVSDVEYSQALEGIKEYFKKLVDK